MSPKKLNPLQNARTFAHQPSPRRQKGASSQAHRLDRVEKVASLATTLAVQPESDTIIETVNELPVATADDIGRQIILRPTGTNEAITYVGVMLSDGTAIWMEISGTTEFLDYSWVRVITGAGSALGVDFLSDGRVLVTDAGATNNVRKFDPDAGSLIETWGGGNVACGSLTAGTAGYNGIIGIAAKSTSEILIVNSACHRVNVYTDATNARTVTNHQIGSGTSGSGTNDFNTPWGVAFGSAYLYVSETGNDRVIRRDVAAPYAYVSTIGSLGTGNGQFTNPRGVAVDTDDNLYVVDTSNNRIQKFTAGGTFIWKVGGLGTGTGPGEFNAPEGCAIDPRGRLHVADKGNNRIQVFDANGTFLTSYGSGPGSGNEQFNGPVDIAIAGTGLVVVTDLGNTRLSVWQEGATTPAVSFLNDLVDVTTSGPELLSFLRWNGSFWTDYDLVVRRRTVTVNAAGNTGTATDVNCNAGEICTGGGAAVVGSGATAWITRSRPITSGGQTGWGCTMYNNVSGSKSLECHAICLEAPNTPLGW